jgi:hypothetical protein
VYEDVSAAISGPWQVLKNLYSGISGFQDNLVDGKPNDWRCRAGARYLYICEDGLVHYCSQQRGYPAVPLESYTIEDIRREFVTPKPCAPYCTVGCVHRVSTMDFWRSPQQSALMARGAPRLRSSDIPPSSGVARRSAGGATAAPPRAEDLALERRLSRSAIGRQSHVTTDD